MSLSPEYLAQQPNFIPMDAWAHDRIRYLIAWMQNHDGVPDPDVANELASLTATWHAQQAAKVQANWPITKGDCAAIIAKIDAQDIPPTGEPLKLSEVPGFGEGKATGFTHNTPADPGIQAEADPWLVIIRDNGHSWRVWDTGKVEYARSPNELFGPSGTEMQFKSGSRYWWFDTPGARYTINPEAKTAWRTRLDGKGNPIPSFDGDIQPEALTWWPG